MGIKHWKEAATVILTARNGCDKSPYNFKIMTMKRSSGNKFMPGGYVFPGGNIHPSDSDNNWLDLFKKFNFNNFEKLFVTNQVPPILKDEQKKVPKSISFRIAAIRETFEESGILLCRDHTNNSENWTNFIPSTNLENWRQKVHQDGYEFLNLCQNLNIYPDIKGLHLWSNWLTPRSMKKRFDTLFFLASVEKIPTSNADDKEVENLTWKTPDHLAEIFKKGEMWLPPPQAYEISRILNFKRIEELYRFAEEVSSKGCERWMPEHFNTLNGSVTVLPGDGAYKVDDYATTEKVNEVNLTKEEFRSGFSVLHRIEHFNNVNSEIIVKNYSPKFNVLPVTS